MNQLVSVIVATYRREQSLFKALCSLAEQTYKNIEIILVDDNWDAKWNEKVSIITQQFTMQYPESCLHLIQNSMNQGSAKSRNIGIEAANGDYVTFLDDDDLYLPQKVEKQLSAMLDNDADYSLTDLYLYNDDGKLVDKRVRKYIDKTDVSSLLANHLMYHMTGTDTLMYRKEYLNHIGGFDLIDVGDEFYLMKKSILGGGKFTYLPGCDVKAFVHSENEGISSGSKKIEGENQLFRVKQEYFSVLTKKQIKYIKVRHYAVLAFVALHHKQLADLFKNAMKAVLTSPIFSIQIFLSR